MREFLEKILPDEGYYCLAIRKKSPEGGHYFIHKAFDNLDDAVSLSKKAMNTEDMFFAMGSLKELKDESGKTRRVQSNIKELKCLWLDLDCGANKDYATQNDATKHLKAFVAELELPTPTVVNSGNGVHCYWTFIKAISAEDWMKLAKRFKSVTQSWGLKADHACTADCSRVLRVAGTFNHKNGEKKDVKVLRYGNDSQLADIVIPLKQYLVDHPEAKPKETSTVPDYLKAFGSNLEDRKDFSLKLILDNCQQMRATHEEGGPAGYQRRADYISIAKFCEDADYDILLDNDPDPDLVDSQTAMLLKSSHTEHPHRCETFESNRQGGCDGCKFKGIANSPISLEGLIKQPVKQAEYDAMPPEEKAKVGTVVPDDFKPTMALPEGFYYQGNWLCTKSASEGDEFEKVNRIFDGILEPVEVLEEKQGGIYSVTVRIIHGKDGERRRTFPMTEVSEPKALIKRLAGYGVLTQSSAQKHLVNYMSSFINMLKNAKKSTQEVTQLGWVPITEEQDESEAHKYFVLPGKVIDKSGANHDVTLSDTIKGMKPYFGRAGNLNSWKKIINTYALPGYEGYAFAHLCGYGSLLMEMTQMRSGMISIQGNSGSGKSTVLRTINSIFIRPDSYMTKQDTQNSKFARIGIMNNLCSTFDEVSNMEPQDVSDLAYSVTQGRGKDRLTANAALQANTTSWAQLLVCTTNHSLIHKLSNYKSDASAESFRIFEYSLNTQGHILSKIEADDVFEQLNDHYGLAGEVFVQYMVNHYDEIKTRMRAWQREFDVRMGMANNERYWSAMAACNMVGGYIAKELGLHDFNMETIENWLTETVTKMRGVVSDNVKDAKQVLSDFITSHVGSTLIIDKYENVLPRDKIFLRFDSDNSRLYIDKTYMRKYVTKNGGDWEAVTGQLAKEGVVVSDNHRIVMTKGTKLPAAGQTYTMVFDTEHPAMAGVRLEELKVKVG